MTGADKPSVLMNIEERVEEPVLNDALTEQVEVGLSSALIMNSENKSMLEENQAPMENAASATPLLDFTDSADIKAQRDSQEPEAIIQEKWTEDRINAENEVLVSANELLRDQVSQFKRLTNIFGITAAVLLLLFIGASIYVSNQLKQRDNRIEYLLTQIHINNVKQEASVQSRKIEPRKQSAIAANKTKKTVSRPVSKSSLEKSPMTGKVATGQVQQASPKKAAREEEPSRATLYDKDPRVRTGAYNIIGIDQIVTVRRGQTLKSISKNHLGPGMECYVEAVNDGVKELAEGQKIKIPKLKLKKK